MKCPYCGGYLDAHKALKGEYADNKAAPAHDSGQMLDAARGSAPHAAAKPAKPKKLIYAQREALRRLEDGEWHTAWSMMAASSTLFALERMGRVERKQAVERRTGYDSTDFAWRVKSHNARMSDRPNNEKTL